MLFQSDEIESTSNEQYLVLARKYRPQTFVDLIGQEALVTTFTNAIASNRVAHAFLLTGIRGVGKTTTARIIARALNCTGEDGNGQMTINPCGKCYQCTSISEDRNQDVIEIDAASHTGVNDIREIIENARYKPVSSRFKVYIIDEVHMLSNSAFNALLKTLEEPPLHVKFIFATTELRKIPLTILSRCQRFDLKRVTSDDLVKHFTNILHKEKLSASENSLRLIANAAGGSVRDGLSILDQAISHTQGSFEVAAIQEMLGLSSNENLYELFFHIAAGSVEKALSSISGILHAGAEPLTVITELMLICNVVARSMLGKSNSVNISDHEKELVAQISNHLDVAKLSRLWMAMVRGFDEIKTAHNPVISVEMVVIRLANICNLPSPEDLIKGGANLVETGKKQQAPDTKAPEKSVAPVADNDSRSVSSLEDIEHILFEADEMVLCHHLRTDVRLVKFEQNKLVINISEAAPRTLTADLKNALDSSTGRNWVVMSTQETGQNTLAEQSKILKQKRIDEVIDSSMVKAILNNFTGVEIADIKLSNQ